MALINLESVAALSVEEKLKLWELINDEAVVALSVEQK